MLAEAYWLNGQSETALQTLVDASRLAIEIGEPWWDAEIQRLKGVVLLSESINNVVDAESSFLKALDISREQKSISLELRVAVSLAHLWLRENKADMARQLLAESIAKHKEGFDTPDYKAAQKLLKEIHPAN